MPTISIVTLADSVEHLGEAYDALVASTGVDWEWVLGRLGSVSVPAHIAANPRVSVLDVPQWIQALGAGAGWKHLAEKSSAPLLLGVEQHARVEAGALERVVAALADGADAVYGDFAPLDQGNVAAAYPSAEGWLHAPAAHGASVVRAFDMEPAALADARYAPLDGVAWRAERYFALGGHDQALGTTALYDLLCRAYLSGYEVQHIDGCVVHTRRGLHERRDASVDRRVAESHFQRTVMEWARRRGLRLLDLGGAHNAASGFEAVDLVGGDINCDIRFGLPLADNSVGCIRASDFLEHMNHCPDSTCAHGVEGGPRCVVGVMNEFHRVLAPGGWLITRTPSSDGRGAFQDPTHVSFWNPNSFWYYTREEQARYVRGITCRYQARRIYQDYPTPWHEANHILYVHADLSALKGQRQAGRVEI